MKKVLIIAAQMLAAITPMMAQEWRFRNIEADELRGTEKDSVAVFVSKKYSVLVSFTTQSIYISSKECLFDYHKNEYWVMIGMYDAENNLISKERQFCYYPAANSYTLVHIQNAKHLRKDHPGDTIVTRFIAHLNSGEGKIRIICPMYQCNDLDVVLPPFSKQEE